MDFLDEQELRNVNPDVRGPPSSESDFWFDDSSKHMPLVGDTVSRIY